MAVADLSALSPQQQAIVRQAAAWLAKRGYAVTQPSLYSRTGTRMTTVGTPVTAGAETYAPWMEDNPTPGQNAVVFAPNQMVPPVYLHELLHSRGVRSISPDYSPQAAADEEGYVQAAALDNLPAYYRRHPNAPLASTNGYVADQVNKARLSSAAYYQPGTKWNDPHAVRVRRRVVNMSSDQRMAELERQRKANIRRAQLRMT